MVVSLNLGFPRMGENRELKKLVENYWASKCSSKDLLDGAKSLRQNFWQKQKQSGIELIPSNDFSFYDHILDHIFAFGVIPQKYTSQLGSPQYGSGQAEDYLRLYFAMPRGYQTYKAGQPDVIDVDLPAMEMKKWFDTNYHYIVPEFSPSTEFKLSSSKAVDEFLEAKALGIVTKPVLIGPVSFLLLGKPTEEGFNQLTLLPKLLPVYEALLKKLAEAGAQYVQLDEPFLVCDLPSSINSSFKLAYEKLTSVQPSLKILLATYFGSIGNNIQHLNGLKISALHIDLIRGAGQLDAVLPVAQKNGWSLSLGVVDGRNIWIGDLAHAKSQVDKAVQVLGGNNVLVGPSCSLLHVPYSLDKEKGSAATINHEILEWMAFASEKLIEIVGLAHLANNSGDANAKKLLDLSVALKEKHKTSPLIHNPKVQKELSQITAAMKCARTTPSSQRIPLQKKKMGLPLYPSTTVGSFPQTQEVRAKRSEFLKGKLSAADYETYLREQIKSCIKKQEEYGLDVLVHGEFERNDMVEYFGEKMQGYAFSKNGWVQSYGSRCVKPPIIYGDIDRPSPMTVDYIKYAQSVSSKPVKGMLTGPVTMLQWSFVRIDQSRELTTQQLALAIRKEVIDLEKADIVVIQIDEPAIREGLPLRSSEWNAYLKWAVECFHISSNAVREDTQIQTHMCYSDFNDIMPAIAGMDADVNMVENSKADLKLLKAFQNFNYPNDIGPGLYDVHSPLVPNVDDMVVRLQAILKYFEPSKVWINPDCGLKTRGWKEVDAALRNLVQVAKIFRTKV